MRMGVEGERRRSRGDAEGEGRGRTVRGMGWQKDRKVMLGVKRRS